MSFSNAVLAVATHVVVVILVTTGCRAQADWGDTPAPPTTTLSKATTTERTLGPGETYAPLATPTTKSPDQASTLPLEPWVIAILAFVGIVLCGGMVYAAKRAKRKREAAKIVEERKAKVEREFHDRLKKIAGQ